MPPTVHTEIDHLLQAIAEQDDQHAFKKLFTHFLPKLTSFAITILQNREMAEEVVGDVFFKIWQSRKTLLLTINNISYYLHTATKNTALNYLKSRNHFVFSDLDEQAEQVVLHTPEQSMIQKEHLHDIEKAISALPLKCRLIFRLVKEEGLKYREVAQLLSISVKTVEGHMTQAYARILDLLKTKMPEFTALQKKTS